MDFITRLPPSSEKGDYLSGRRPIIQACPFLCFGIQSHNAQVAEIMLWDVIKIYGVPAQIISDRDPLFMSGFCRNCFIYRYIVGDE